MAFKVQRVEYYYTTVKDVPSEAYELLSHLAGLHVNLLAFNAVPMGPSRTQLTLFPSDSSKLISAADKCGLVLDGPHSALLVQGDDELGALATVHGKLADAKVNVYASTGVSDGKGSYGYVLYVRPEKFEQAARAFDLS